MISPPIARSVVLVVDYCSLAESYSENSSLKNKRKTLLSEADVRSDP